jgi:hypothetical protein
MFVPAQLFIWTCCATLYFSSGRDWRPAFAVLLVMQLGSLAAAARAARPKPVTQNANDRLPLHRRS